VLSIKRHDLHFHFMLLSNTSTTAHKPRISVLLEPAVVNVPRFQSCHFSRISKLRSVESCPDVSQRCNDCSLRQSPISFVHKAFWCKIRSQKLANSACVNLSRQISAQSESNLTPDCLRSLVRFPQIFQSFTLTKLDRLSTVDLHSRLYRTSNKLSSG
jgi:hypothetical protein